MRQLPLEDRKFELLVPVEGIDEFSSECSGVNLMSKGIEGYRLER